MYLVHSFSQGDKPFFILKDFPVATHAWINKHCWWYHSFRFLMLLCYWYLNVGWCSVLSSVVSVGTGNFFLTDRQLCDLVHSYPLCECYQSSFISAVCSTIRPSFEKPIHRASSHFTKAILWFLPLHDFSHLLRPVSVPSPALCAADGADPCQGGPVLCTWGLSY